MVKRASLNNMTSIKKLNELDSLVQLMLEGPNGTELRVVRKSDFVMEIQVWSGEIQAIKCTYCSPLEWQEALQRTQ